MISIPILQQKLELNLATRKEQHMAKIHAGLWLECKVCPHTPEELELKKREKRERPNLRRKRMDVGATLDTQVRRQVAYELGGPDAEPTKDQKFQILQKYGIA